MERTADARVLASSSVPGFIFQFPARKYLRPPPRRRRAPLNGATDAPATNSCEEALRLALHKPIFRFHRATAAAQLLKIRPGPENLEGRLQDHPPHPLPALGGRKESCRSGRGASWEEGGAGRADLRQRRR